MTGDDGVELSKEELRAIRRLKKLAKEWPSTLWLFSEGSMHVMRYGPDGKQMTEGPQGSVDQLYTVATIMGLPAEGGGY